MRKLTGGERLSIWYPKSMVRWIEKRGTLRTRAFLNALTRYRIAVVALKAEIRPLVSREDLESLSEAISRPVCVDTEALPVVLAEIQARFPTFTLPQAVAMLDALDMMHAERRRGREDGAEKLAIWE